MHTQNRLKLVSLLIPFCLLFATSCGFYRQNIMFRTKNDINIEQMRLAQVEAEKNYIIQPNDYINVRVFTNKGERILDPNGVVNRTLMGLSSSGEGNSGGNQMRMANQSQQELQEQVFLVQNDGIVKLPMVDYVKVAGLTLLQTDSLLQVLFTQFYKDVFVITKITSNRIIVLGAQGGQVLPLTNDNLNLIEVIAMVGGINNNGKAHNIRLIRGDLQNPSVQVIDLTTIDGMRKASLNVEPNDIVYIEPVRRVIFEGIRDVTPVLSLFTTTLTTYFLIKSLTE